MRVVMHREARAELRVAAQYYGDVRPELQARFESHIIAAINRIRSHPQQFPLVVKEFRRLVLDVFPYEIFSELLPSRIKILAIAHSSREPMYWIGRS